MYLYFGTGTCAVPTAEAVSTGDINGSNCTGRLRSIPSFPEMIVQACEDTHKKVVATIDCIIKHVLFQ